MIFDCEHTSSPFLSWRTRTGHALDRAKFCSSKRTIYRRASCHQHACFRLPGWVMQLMGIDRFRLKSEELSRADLRSPRTRCGMKRVEARTIWLCFRASDSLCFSSMLFRCHSPRFFFSRFVLSLMFLFQRLMEIILRVCSSILRLRLSSLEILRTTWEKLDAATWDCMIDRAE